MVTPLAAFRCKLPLRSRHTLSVYQAGLIFCTFLFQAASTCQDVYGPGMDQYFEPSVFLRLARDGNGAVSLLSLFNYIMRRNAMLQTVQF